jgi:DNA-binding NarL/FixJ family response regulator
VYQALAAGAHGYLLKQAASRQIVEALRCVHAGRRYLCPEAMAAVADQICRPAQASPIESLSARERQVLQLVAEGRSSAQIAGLLQLSAKTVDTYRSRLMQKLGIADVAALVKFAVLHGLTPLE